MGQRPSGAARLQPRNGCPRQQNSTDYLGRAAYRRTLPRRCLKPPADCETTEKWVALIEPTREEPDYYRGLPGLPAVEVIRHLADTNRTDRLGHVLALRR